MKPSLEGLVSNVHRDSRGAGLSLQSAQRAGWFCFGSVAAGLCDLGVQKVPV